jgi:hypothetical protein
MSVTAELLKAINREVQGIPIEEERWKELVVEVNQLRQAAESALGMHDFDRDPAEFSILLRKRGAEQQPDSQHAEIVRRTSQPISLRGRRPH